MTRNGARPWIYASVNHAEFGALALALNNAVDVTTAEGQQEALMSQAKGVCLLARDIKYLRSLVTTILRVDEEQLPRVPLFVDNAGV